MSSLKNLVTSLWRMTQSRAQPLCARVTSCKREEGVFFFVKRPVCLAKKLGRIRLLFVCQLKLSVLVLPILNSVSIKFAKKEQCTAFIG